MAHCYSLRLPPMDVYKFSIMIDCSSVSKNKYYTKLFSTWKGAFKLLAFPVFLLYLLINLISRYTNRTGVSEVLPYLDTVLGLT